MPNYHAQYNSIKSGKFFGGLDPKEAGRRGGLKKRKSKKKDDSKNEDKDGEEKKDQE
jgi:hypothetical protein